jgi:hypothetical protein
LWAEITGLPPFDEPDGPGATYRDPVPCGIPGVWPPGGNDVLSAPRMVAHGWSSLNFWTMSLVPILEEHLGQYVPAPPERPPEPGSEADALDFTSPEGHPLRRTKSRPRWAKACRKAGVTGLHFHDLRGSGATWAAVAGATCPNGCTASATAPTRRHCATSTPRLSVTERSQTVLAFCCGRTAPPKTRRVPTWSKSRTVESHYST